MGETTSISWTDHTFNPWWGCTQVSPGCDHCYAEAFDHRVGGAHWGKGVPRREFSDKHWALPLKWERAAARDGKIAKVFCASMADVMDDEAPAGARERLWATIDATPHLYWQLLTKRPHRYSRYLPKHFAHHNVALGFTAENQYFYSARVEHAYAAAARLNGGCDGVSRRVPVWCSYEPALGPLTLSIPPDWIIFGGETGPGHRPMEQKWAEDLRAECLALHVPFFMKQMGGPTPVAAAALIPAHLLIRQFPTEMEGHK